MKKRFKRSLLGYVSSSFVYVRRIIYIHSISQNKEAEAKEELKRRARQLEMQRREQQKRNAAGGIGGGSSFLGAGGSGYTPISRFDTAEPTPVRTASPAPAASRPPAFKSGGMKLGSKKTRQAELLDALGGEAISSEEISAPSTPVINEHAAPTKTEVRSNLPAVTPER